jgi:hypothetical protein
MKKIYTASEMAALRWAKTTPEERIAHSKKMTKALKLAREKRGK